MMMRRGAVLLKHKKPSPDGQPVHVWQWPLSTEVVATVLYGLFTLTPNVINLIVTNPVLGKNLEHLPLTR